MNNDDANVEDIISTWQSKFYVKLLESELNKNNAFSDAVYKLYALGWTRMLVGIWKLNSCLEKEQRCVSQISPTKRALKYSK